MFFSQIRSHAQKYFLRVQKNGTNEYVPPPRAHKKKLHTLHPVFIKKKTTHTRCLKPRREEIEQFAAIEEKLENPFTIKKCITVLEELSDIPIDIMIKAADIFKDNSSNREVFSSFSDDLVRRTWLL